MFILLSLFAVFLTCSLNYRCDEKIKNWQIDRKAFLKLLKDGLATFGLTFWSALLAVSLFESKDFPVLSNIKSGRLQNPLDFLLETSALFLLFPFVFNLIKMYAELLLLKNWRAAFINFIYNVMCEFGVFWAIIILAFYLL